MEPSTSEGKIFDKPIHALELEVLFIAICTAILVLKILGGGRLNPNLM